MYQASRDFIAALRRQQELLPTDKSARRNFRAPGIFL